MAGPEARVRSDEREVRRKEDQWNQVSMRNKVRSPRRANMEAARE